MNDFEYKGYRNSVRELIDDIVREADYAVRGIAHGSDKLDGIILRGKQYRDLVYEKLAEDGQAVFYEEDRILPNVILYDVDLDELFELYRRNGNLDESEFCVLANGLERTSI